MNPKDFTCNNKKMKEHKYPLKGEWMDKQVWYIHTMEHYSAI